MLGNHREFSALNVALEVRNVKKISLLARFDISCIFKIYEGNKQ